MTPFRCLTVRVFVVAFLLIALSAILRAQSNDARITGIVTDPSKAIIRGAKVNLVNVDTGVSYPSVTNGSGIYAVSGQVGNYRIEVEHVGFKTVIAPGIVLHTQDVLEVNFEMAVGSTSETVTVNAGATNDNPAVSMTVTREFIENMPLNGRSFQDLIQLAPGTVASGNNGISNGYYSINGQRSDSNNFTVDGVSANLGGINNGPNGNTGSGLSGSAPSQTALGTTQSLASVDSLEEFTIQTSGFTAEFGRDPGGQVEFTTRSGTNDIHGSLFDYLRNTAFDANTWFNDDDNIPQSAEHQNDFGGTIGGPLMVPKLYNGRDKTFYFFSYEGLRLLLPAFESEYVPTRTFRQWASPNVQPFLNASPLPSPNSLGNQDGCTVPDPTSGQPTPCDALFNYSYSYPNNLDNISLRADERLSRRISGFVRYADTPSSTKFGGENVQTMAINAHTWTAGLTAILSTRFLNDLRFNYSRDAEQNVESLRSVGGSVPLSRNLLIASAYDTPFAEGGFDVYVPGAAFYVAGSFGGTASELHQYNLVDSFSWTQGTHSVKFGIDWRHLASAANSAPAVSQIGVSSLADIQQGNATQIYTAATAPGMPIFTNLSVYAQDHWKMNERLNIDYGLRWEFNPPPGPSNGRYPVTLTSDDLSTAQLAPLGTPPYKTYYDKFAPRIGFAFRAIPSQKYSLTVRGGFGIFFDTGQQVIGNAYNGAYPFSANGPTQVEVPLPATQAELSPPSLNFPLTPPYPFLVGLSSRNLTSPYTEQWNLSLDEALNSKNTLTMSYVGNNGRKLLFTNYYGNIPGNPLFTALLFASNAAQSSYNAFQVQDVGRVTNGLDVVASFTWAHALDDASSNFSQLNPLYGNSDFDYRRALNLALNYKPQPKGFRGWTHALLRDWMLSNRFATQSGRPLSVIQSYVALADGSESQVFPDLVSNVPIYLHGRAADIAGKPAPGSWRLNPNAFALVPTDSNGNPLRQGTLGRNFVRTASFWALNSAVQRNFPVFDQLHLNFRAEAFNVFNHPNFTSPDPNLPDSTFGQGSGTGTIGSSNQLYAMGSPRSLQFSLKLQF